jgi:hypothetical protein
VRKLLVALGATFVVLLGTGLYQAFRYHPAHASGIWYDATEIVHRVGAFVFAALAFALVVTWARRAHATTRSTFISLVVLSVLVLATVAEIITGRGLRWTQVGMRIENLRPVVRGVVGMGHVEFVRIGATELARSEFSSRVFLHLILFPVGLLLVGGVLWFLSVRDDRRRVVAAGSPNDLDGNDETDLDLEPDVTEAPT